MGDGSAVAGHRGQEVGGGRVAVSGTAGSLAVERHRVRAGRISAGQIGQSAGQTRPTIRRIVAALGATRTLNDPTTRAPRRARACCGALVDHWPIAVYERAPATTAEAATSSTATNG